MGNAKLVHVPDTCDVHRRPPHDSFESHDSTAIGIVEKKGVYVDLEEKDRVQCRIDVAEDGTGGSTASLVANGLSVIGPAIDEKLAFAELSLQQQSLASEKCQPLHDTLIPEDKVADIENYGLISQVQIAGCSESPIALDRIGANAKDGKHEDGCSEHILPFVWDAIYYNSVSWSNIHPTMKIVSVQ